MKRFYSSVALAAALIVAAGGREAAAGAMGYVLGNGGTTLHVFDVGNPAGASTLSLGFSGGSSKLDAIDFRPLTGALYGYDDAQDAYYTIDVNTGTVTSASGAGVAPTNTDKLDVDFNPVIDRLRNVNELDQNIVYNPLTGTASAVTSLFYGAGDPNDGADPQIVANAYTNNVLGGSAASTTQYVLDANLDILATLANNAGTLTTIGPITLGGSPLDFSADAGFDILAGPGGTNTAYALLNVNAVAGLYTIDLGTGAASLVGNFSGQFGTIRGLAIRPVPEPSAIVLSGLGGLCLAAVAARRRKA